MSKLQDITKVKKVTLGKVLKRPRLFDTLDSALSTPLTWITAPAGSGKSTLATSYLQERMLCNLWYNCCKEDNDLTSFFHYLGSSHKQIYPLQQGKLPRLQSKQQLSVTTFGKVFFHKLFSSLSAPFILVFDDFHHIENNSQLHIIIRNSLAYLPSGMSILIISRYIPPPVYARLRAANKLYEIQSNELMLTQQESEELVKLKIRHKYPGKPVIKAWYNKTQGWVTGLLLLLEPLLDNHSFHIVADEAVQAHIFDYVAGEYFDVLEQTTKESLVVTNLLSSFTSNQAIELTGNTELRQILHDMVSCQFITFYRKDTQTIYQFHPLLHDFLLSHLSEIYTDSEVLFLKNKAANLLVDSSHLNDAATLYQQTNNHYALSQLLVKQASKVYKQGNLSLLQNWISSLPKEIIAQEPWLAYWLGMTTIQVNPIIAKSYFEVAINKFMQTNEVKGTYLSWAGIASSTVLALHTFKGAQKWMKLLDDIQQQWPDFPDIETGIQVTFSGLGY